MAPATGAHTRSDPTTEPGTDRSSHITSHRYTIARANAAVTDRDAVSATHGTRPHSYRDSKGAWASSTRLRASGAPWNSRLGKLDQHGGRTLRSLTTGH